MSMSKLKDMVMKDIGVTESALILERKIIGSYILYQYLFMPEKIDPPN